MSHRIPPSMDDVDTDLPLEVERRMISQWYAVRVCGGRENTAHDGLTEHGFTVFMPCETQWRVTRWSKTKIETPLYRGYMFVACSTGRFEEVCKIEGVQQFVRYVVNGEMTPMPIPLAAIIEIQSSERAGRYDTTRTYKPPYRPKKGDKVKVTAGPWQSYIGKLLDTPAKSRALVMIEGPHGRGVTLDVAHLAAA